MTTGVDLFAGAVVIAVDRADFDEALAVAKRQVDALSFERELKTVERAPSVHAVTAAVRLQSGRYVHNCNAKITTKRLSERRNAGGSHALQRRIANSMRRSFSRSTRGVQLRFCGQKSLLPRPNFPRKCLRTQRICVLCCRVSFSVCQLDEV